MKKVSEEDLLKYRELMERIRNKHGIDGAFWVDPVTGMIFEPEVEKPGSFIDKHREEFKSAGDRGEEMRKYGDEIRRKGDLKRKAMQAKGDRLRKEALDRAGKSVRDAAMPAGARPGATPGDDVEELISSAVARAEGKRQERQDGVVIENSESEETDAPEEGDKWSRHAPGFGDRRGRRGRRATTPPTWPPATGRDRRKMDREALEESLKGEDDNGSKEKGKEEGNGKEETGQKESA